MKLVIVGQGYVGLPLAQAACAAGLDVVGLDKNAITVERLNSGESHVGDISNGELASMIAGGYRASEDWREIASADVVVVCVPTPLDSSGHPDLSAVLDTSRRIADNLTSGTVVILESTTYPGTTEEIVRPILETSGLVLDADFFLAFSPERIDPGRTDYGLTNTPKVVGGVSEESTERACRFYGHFVADVVPVSGSREAEMAKLLENTYRHVNIALVNEMAKFCHDLDIDLWEVIRAASTKPFGFQAFYPGPGVGGHCIPIDPNYLSFQVQQKLGYPFKFVELAEEINNSMPRYVVDRIQEILNDECRSVKGARILLLGVTYKANIADQRESPARAIGRLLLRLGATVEYNDPYVSRWEVDGYTVNARPDLDSAISDADIAVLLQSHREYDTSELSSKANLLLDTRGSAVGTKAHRL